MIVECKSIVLVPSSTCWLEMNDRKTVIWMNGTSCQKGRSRNSSDCISHTTTIHSSSTLQLVLFDSVFQLITNPEVLWVPRPHCQQILLIGTKFAINYITSSSSYKTKIDRRLIRGILISCQTVYTRIYTKPFKTKHQHSARSIALLTKWWGFSPYSIALAVTWNQWNFSPTKLCCYFCGNSVMFSLFLIWFSNESRLCAYRKFTPKGKRLTSCSRLEYIYQYSVDTRHHTTYSIN